jgi:CHAT domain-containing protein
MADRMGDVAHLVCDIATGIGKPDPASWKNILDPDYLRFRIIGDAMKALCNVELPEKSLEISQRFKSTGFCWPNIERLRNTSDGPPELEAYLKGLDRLYDATGNLRLCPDEEIQQRAEAVRAAGESLLELGDLLRERDSVLGYRAGALVPLQDLLDCLPLNSPVAIADIAVCSDCTIVHVIYRARDRVQVTAARAPFSAADAQKLLEVWAKGHVAHEISAAQRNALLEIGKTLHDSLFCGLASLLAQHRLTQVILIPDPLTRHLPLHLAWVCEKNVQEVLNAIQMKPKPKSANFFCDVFPVEYASCLQAAATSASQKRPRQIKTVLSMADPHGDLPGARETARWLHSQISKHLTCVTKVGKDATLANLKKNLGKANVVVAGTHGSFNSAAPAESKLEFYDGSWSLAEMVDHQELTNGPVLVLSACEVGATAPTLDEIEASGIPGALVSAGAGSILAALWPVEDISMGYVIERFLTHVSWRGFRPSAALFRAIYDLRRWPRAKVLERCREAMKRMKSDGLMETPQYLMLDNLAVGVEDSRDKYPFDSPQYWGGIIVVGSGWQSSAGAITAGAKDVIALAESLVKRKAAAEYIKKRNYEAAREILSDILPLQEGIDRGVTLYMLASAVWGGRGKDATQATRKESLELLRQAEVLAKSEQDPALQKRIQVTRSRIQEDKTQRKK